MTDQTERRSPVAAWAVREFWEPIAPAWRDCFLLAWQSFQAHSIPVGAVLVDGSGTIVARGRNRCNESDVPNGQLGGSHIAHAEINALAALPAGDYTDHVLYATLEPCFLCTAALRYSHVGTVRFAAPDPVWSGVERLPQLNRHIARRWTRREGPLGGPLQDVAAVLHLVSALDRGGRTVVECHERAMPQAVRVARTLAGSMTAEIRAGTLPEALNTLLPMLVTDPASISRP